MSIDTLDDFIKYYYQTRENWNKLSLIEQTGCSNSLNKYLDLKKMGIPVRPPEAYVFPSLEGRDEKGGFDQTVKKTRKRKTDNPVSTATKRCNKKDNETELYGSILKNDEVLEIRQNPSRKNKYVKNYTEKEVPTDSFVWCDNCDVEVEDSCVRCGGLVQLINTAVSLNTPDRAKLTVPKDMLEVRPSKIHGLGVWTLKKLPKGIKMGPYEGALLRKPTNSSYCWLLRDNKVVDGEDVTISNWLRYVNCARKSDEQNLVAFQYRGGMYYRSVVDIPAGQELLVYYGKDFALELGIDVNKFYEPAEEELGQVFPCKYCSAAFAAKHYLDQHIIRCKSKYDTRTFVPEGFYQCPGCIACLTSKTMYDEHVKWCRGLKKSSGTKAKVNQIYKYFCNKCDYKSKQPKYLDYHMTKEHGDTISTWYHCNHCKYKTLQKCNLIKHLKIHSSVKEFTCPMCKRSFNQKHQVQWHLDKHNNVVRYKCDDCDYGTDISSNLKQHITHVHSKDRNYVCRYCPYRSAQKGNLTTHINYKHAGKKRFKCPHNSCDYATVQNGQLQSHINRIHNKDKPYQCYHCDYRASVKCDLSQHIKKHHLN